MYSSLSHLSFVLTNFIRRFSFSFLLLHSEIQIYQKLKARKLPGQVILV